MNYAIKINAIVNSLWPDHYPQSNHLISQQNLNQLDLFLDSLSINEFHQIIELCTQKSLFIVLQKTHIVIKKHIHYKAQLLKQMNMFFQNWVLPQFPYNLKRSYDVNCLEHYFEGSVGKIIGKIMKQMSKSNSQSDWNIISTFIISLSGKSHFYQILVILGYFCEIQNLEEEFEEYDSVRQILKNFEYEIIPKVMQMVIGNISFCKETLQLVELQAMSTQLLLINEDSDTNKNMSMKEISFNESINQSKIKYLKMNFEILRKVVEFNYQMEFKENNQKFNQSKEKGVSTDEQKMKWNSFPEYMIRLLLESGLISSLYEIAQILIGFKLPVKDVGLGFGEIVLDLINKIIRTKVEELNKELEQKLMRQILKGQSVLMKKISQKANIKQNLSIKIIRGNIKLLKNMTLKEILSINQGQQWIAFTLKQINFVMLINPHIDTQNYLIYKTISLIKELVYQTILYQIPSKNQTISNQIFITGIKIQEVFIRSFVCSSKLQQKNKYYSLQDLRTKRDRHFHNLKTLSQIHLPQLNNLLQSILPSLNSVQSAGNYLLLVSYYISPQFMNCTSYFYLSHNLDVTTFKKLTIGNGLILTQQLLKANTQQKAQHIHSQDAALLFIEKLLQLYLEHEINITMTFTLTDTPLHVDQSLCQLISNKPKLLTSLFLHIFRIIHIKAQKNAHSEDDSAFHFYFQAFIKYLTLLVNQNRLLQPFQIISIQCQLKQNFLQFKTYLRGHFKLEERKFLSEITALLNHQPQIPQKSQGFKQKMSSFIHSQILELLNLLKYNSNDWIGICYEIGGFLQLINEQKTYFKIITLIGHQFFSKIFMSCIDNINLQRIKLLTYFIASFLDFTQDQKIINLTFWLDFVKPIFLSWIELFKIFSNFKYQEEEWGEVCYGTLRNLLQNENLNFYMLKRSVSFKEIIQNFTSEFTRFMNFSIEKKMNSLQDTGLFRVMRVAFRYFSDYYLQNKNNNLGKDFLKMVENLIQFVRCKLNLVNNRKCQNLTQSIEALKALQIILQYFSETCLKYSYKVNLIQTIRQFVNKQESVLKVLQNQLHKFTVNYEKYIKFSSQKYRKSEMDLFLNSSKIICELCDIQKSTNCLKANKQNTMSSSEEENIGSKHMRSSDKQDETLMHSLNSLEKQFVWFDIQGDKQIIDY